jgi:transposase InsO family protein
VKYAWIEEHRVEFSTTMMCELLSASRSGLDAMRKRQPSKRSVGDAELLVQIRQSQQQHHGRYGRRRMTTEISEAQGQPVNHMRIARVMREHGLQSHKRRRFRVVTTDSKHDHGRDLALAVCEKFSKLLGVELAEVGGRHVLYLAKNRASGPSEDAAIASENADDTGFAQPLPRQAEHEGVELLA